MNCAKLTRACFSFTSWPQTILLAFLGSSDHSLHYQTKTVSNLRSLYSIGRRLIIAAVPGSFPEGQMRPSHCYKNHQCALYWNPRLHSAFQIWCQGWSPCSDLVPLASSAAPYSRGSVVLRWSTASTLLSQWYWSRSPYAFERAQILVHVYQLCNSCRNKAT